MATQTGGTMTKPTLDELRSIVDLSEGYRYPGDEWTTYDATITRRGKAYPIGTVTVYDHRDNAHILVMRHHTLRTVAQRETWDEITDAYGMTRPAPWQDPYTMAPCHLRDSW